MNEFKVRNNKKEFVAKDHAIRPPVHGEANEHQPAEGDKIHRIPSHRKGQNKVGERIDGVLCSCMLA
jgi:hypothetical protein